MKPDVAKKRRQRRCQHCGGHGELYEVDDTLADRWGVKLIPCPWCAARDKVNEDGEYMPPQEDEG